MFEQELTYQKLQIPSSDIYEAMGYKDSMPDGMVIEEINTLLDRITPLLRPRFFFFIADGLLDTEKATLTVKDTVLSIGKTIARQLRGSEAFAFFTATAGVEFEEFQHLLQQEDDMVKVYIADSLGSIIAEKAADCMEEELAVFIEKRGWKHTNRYSPGYCGWHVSEQQKLFSLFPVASPCGIQLTDSSLMIPIKSVSGIIRVGSHGGAFHAPQEIQRILGNGLDKAMQARLATAKVLAKLGYTDDVPMPDFSTKEKAQQYIGLDMAAERTAKEKFLNTIVPQWVKEAQENNRLAKNI